jgi:hypothetical protein
MQEKNLKLIVVLSSTEHSCVSFIRPNDLRTFIGYRFVEHRPITTTKPLAHLLNQNSQPPDHSQEIYSRGIDWLENWETNFSDPDHPLNLNFSTFSDGSAEARVVENYGAQEKIWRFIPSDHGVWMWMTLNTNETIPGGYILQQCLRLTSGIGSGFYPQVAKVPFLSELFMQLLGNPNETLTWTRINNAWQQFPVPFTRYHLASSQGIFEDSAGQADSSHILRESAPREKAPASYWRSVAPDTKWQKMTSGFYWKRSAYISNRHPADCLHIGVDFGPLAAGESRTVLGKFYWIEGGKDDLLELWQKDFGVQSE